MRLSVSGPPASRPAANKESMRRLPSITCPTCGAEIISEEFSPAAGGSAPTRLAAFQAMSHVVASRLGPPEATLRAPFYGLTIPRMNRVCQSLTLLRALDSYGDMEEDSCVIFYFAMLDQWRQVRLGLRQR